MKTVLLFPVIAALAACANVDKAVLPEAHSLEIATLGATQDTIAWPAEQWWQRYGDPQLNTLIEEAISDNPGMVAAQARLARANAGVDAVGADSYPQLGVSFTSTRQRYTENGAIPPPLAGATRTDARLALNVSYDLDFWNKNGALLKAAVSTSRAAEVERRAAASILASTVSTAYFNLQRELAQRTVLDDAIEQRAKVSALTQQRFDAGLDTRVEIKQAESALAQARTQRAQLNEDIALARNQLAALCGQGPARGEQIQAVVLGAPGTDLPLNIPLSLVGRRPDIVAARWRVEAAQGQVAAAHALFYPDINLAAFVGTSALGLSNLFNSGSQILGVGPAITLPLFQGGRLNANLHGREADSNLALAAYNQTVLNAVNEVADTLASVRALEKVQAEQRLAKDAIDQAYALAAKRYRAGLGNYLSVLAAQSAVLEQSRLELDLKARALTLDVALAKALGGGVQLPAELAGMPAAMRSNPNQ